MVFWRLSQSGLRIWLSFLNREDKKVAIASNSLTNYLAEKTR